MNLRKVVRNRNFQAVSTKIVGKKTFIRGNLFKKSKLSGIFPDEPEIYGELKVIRKSGRKIEQINEIQIYFPL